MLLIGADPELFVSDGEQYISAHDLLPGTKANPAEVPFGAVQVDGTAAEFNIKPASTSTEFVHNIGTVMNTMSRLVKLKNKNARLEAVPTAIYEGEYFDSLPDSVKEMGCDPDYNAWTEEPNERPETDLPMRTGGGHIHIGWGTPEEGRAWDYEHYTDCIELTKQLDAVLYPISMLWDNDQRRRQLYGAMGTFRPKDYGVEYRPLSNAWVQDPEVMEWVFNATVKATELLNAGVTLWDTKEFDNVKNNTEKKDVIQYAKHLVDTYGIPEIPESLDVHGPE